MSLLKMVLKTPKSLCFVSLVVIISACSTSGGAKKTDPQNKNVAFVYGYMDMKEAQGRLTWLALRRYRPFAQRYGTRVEDGIFFHIGVDPGSYQIERFGSDASTIVYSSTYYTFGASGKNQTAMNIRKPGLYYIGSYKYVKKLDRRGVHRGFSFEKTKQPDEKQLLTKILELLKDDYAEYTSQIKWVERRLAQL